MARSHKPHAAITAIEVQSLARQARDRYALVVVDEDGGDDIEIKVTLAALEEAIADFAADDECFGVYYPKEDRFVLGAVL